MDNGRHEDLAFAVDRPADTRGQRAGGQQVDQRYVIVTDANIQQDVWSGQRQLIQRYILEGMSLLA